ncbi:hypothetical protein I6N96_09905 [Enterococcus sp. BWM-S5]|uniref:DUF1642 domain-containing protein n=1 Tax=Enterococcus larvae TaxID=2794352 RepID=A0ABS4CKF9_9ENTE|nr:hypothetical protein [Enterococcus larvae]MBP1046601.1 hypothetical protein [Enterococcus larvae]
MDYNDEETVYLYQLLIYKQLKQYVIECIDEKDFYVSEQEKILLFQNKEDIEKYVKRNKIDLEESDMAEETIDLDKLAHWLNEKQIAFDNSEFLTLWNFFDDVSFSIKKIFIGNGNDYDNIYVKLFHGNNLPTINTSGKEYVPEWNDNEIIKIRNVMKAGLELFGDNICIYN